MPFLLEYRLALKLAEANALAAVVPQIQNVQGVAQQIASATGQWQSVQEQADKTAGLAKQVSDRMSAEVKEFTEFMQRSNDTEKANLRLEVEKLRRMETDWLQVSVQNARPRIRFASRRDSLRSAEIDRTAREFSDRLPRSRPTRRPHAYGANAAEPFDSQKTPVS